MTEVKWLKMICSFSLCSVTHENKFEEKEELHPKTQEHESSDIDTTT
jgi:hypothetical protein